MEVRSRDTIVVDQGRDFCSQGVHSQSIQDRRRQQTTSDEASLEFRGEQTHAVLVGYMQDKLPTP